MVKELIVCQSTIILQMTLSSHPLSFFILCLGIYYLIIFLLMALNKC